MTQTTGTPLIVPTAQAVIKRRRIGEGVTIGVLVFFISGYSFAFLINKLLLQFGTGFGPFFNSHYLTWLRSLAYFFSAGEAWPDAVPAYWRWAVAQPPLDFAVLYFMPIISAGAALTCAWWSGWHIAKPRDPHVHVRGRQLRQGEEARQYAQRASREKCAISGAAIKIHDSIVLARHQVLESVLVMGSQGGGKTQILWRFVLSLINRGWKTVIFDLAKGDYTISTPDVHRLFALGDTRSSVWAIWDDIKTLPDAESFARGLIPETSDPVWSNASRGVVIAMLMRLISERGQDWRWRDLGETTFASLEEVKEFAARHYPPALAAVEDAESKTTQSIRINYMSYLAPLYRFCSEWADLPETFSSGKSRAFSWINWLDDDSSADRNIILQSNAKDKTSAVALIRAMMEVQVSHIASLEFSESKTRSIFYMLDELPQIGRLECLPTMMEVGRSKGCAVGLAFQDIAQIRQIYPKGEDDKWIAMLGIRIFAKVKGGASAKFVLEQIGTREVERPTTSVTASGGGYSVSNSYQRAELPVMTADELEKLGPQRDGVKAIILGHSSDVLELTWPYYTPPELRKAKVARLAVIPNTPAQVNGSETKAAGASIDHANLFKIGSELVNNPLKNGSFEIVETPETPAEKSSFETPETSETRANTENPLATDIPEIPEFFTTIENPETENNKSEQLGMAETVADEAVQHVIAEVIAETVGIEPEAVEAGLALVDELSGSGGNGETEVVKVMTLAQMRKSRKREREAAE